VRLIHYSNQYITSVATVEQANNPRGNWYKPHGLWVTTPGEDDWPSWCRGEEFRLDMLTHATEVILSPTANLLVIEGKEQLRAFHKEYSKLPSFAEELPAEQQKLFRGHAVRWGDIAERYDGIVITPYVWDMRLDHSAFWYYTWDCASGCIWNASAVAELVPLPVVPSSAAALVRQLDID